MSDGIQGLNSVYAAYPRSPKSISRGVSSDHHTSTRPVSDVSCASRTTASATCAGVSSVAGTWRSTRCSGVSDSQYWRGPSLEIHPGASAFTRMPSRAASSASPVVNRSNPALAASYAAAARATHGVDRGAGAEGGAEEIDPQCVEPMVEWRVGTKRRRRVVDEDGD